MKLFFLQVRWGEKSIVALYLSVLSGLVLALQYDPAAPFYSVSTIDILIPFGAFWRALHYFASQLFFLLAVAHVVVMIWNKSYQGLPLLDWAKLILTLPVAILLLFTGYVLRGDATGEAAGVIAENLALSLPLAGKWLNGLFFSIAADGLRRIYANHLIGLGILWVVLAWEHIRRYRLNWGQQYWLIIGLVGGSVIFNAPMEPARLGVFHIPGPWFFLGIQELLRVVQPVWAGVVFPSSFILALAGLSSRRQWRGIDVRQVLLAYVLVWLGIYALLTAVGFARSI